MHGHGYVQSEAVVNKGIILYANFSGMAKILPKVARWQPSETPAVSYRFYWATCKAIRHNLCYEDVGTVTKIILPHDIPTFPLIAAKMVLGVSAISHSGAESEITTVIADIDFTIPKAPKNLRVEDE